MVVSDPPHCGSVATHALVQEGTLFSCVHIYYAHLTSVRFEHSACRGSLITIYITLLAWLAEDSLLHWYQQCVTVPHVPK